MRRTLPQWAAPRYIFPILLLLFGCGPVRPPADSVPDTSSHYVVRVPGHARVVVFVHGLFGDPRETWRNRSTGVSWPELIGRDPAFDTFNVFTVGFESPFIGHASNIVEVAARVRDQLVRKGVFDHSEIYFITHSLGGVVAKQMLVDLYTPADAEKLRQVKAVLFFSVPATELADAGQWLSPNPQIADMRSSEVNTFNQGMERRWLRLLRDRDRERADFPLVFCAYETRGITGGPGAVNRVYATTRCDNDAYPVDLDHGQIVKPPSEKADVYDWARHRIQEAAAMVIPTEQTVARRGDGKTKVISAPGVGASPKFDAIFPEIRTDELELSRWGRLAFEAGEYAAAIRFFQQARAVQSGRVWRSSYPYFAGACLLVNEPSKAAEVLEEMRKEMAQPYGYLTDSALLGFLLQGFGEVRRRILPEQRVLWDAAIQEVLVAKAAASAREDARGMATGERP